MTITTLLQLLISSLGTVFFLITNQYPHGSRALASRYKRTVILSRICHRGIFCIHEHTKINQILVLASIAVACFVDTACAADWIVDLKVDVADAENGKKVRILKILPILRSYMRGIQPGANEDEEDDDDDDRPVREEDQVPYGLSRLWSVPFLRVPMSKLAQPQCFTIQLKHI